MCTLALLRAVSPEFPIVIAANRDEFFARSARGPELLVETPHVVAGRDLEAGGTWLGCRVRSGKFFAAGLLNRRLAASPSPRAGAKRSRGLLCLDALGCDGVAAALDALGRAGYAAYEPFNLLLVDPERAVVVDNHDGITTTELGPGLSVLTNLAVNDPRCPRLASAYAGFAGMIAPMERGIDADAIVAGLAGVLGDHSGSSDPASEDPFARVCVHAGAYGTRSSSIVMAAADGRVRYFHAADAPCRSPFREVHW